METEGRKALKKNKWVACSRVGTDTGKKKLIGNRTVKGEDCRLYNQISRKSAVMITVTSIRGFSSGRYSMLLRFLPL